MHVVVRWFLDISAPTLYHRSDAESNFKKPSPLSLLEEIKSVTSLIMKLFSVSQKKSRDFEYDRNSRYWASAISQFLTTFVCFGIFLQSGSNNVAKGEVSAVVVVLHATTNHNIVCTRDKSTREITVAGGDWLVAVGAHDGVMEYSLLCPGVKIMIALVGLTSTYR